jgi:transcription initiation factor TFIIIB Brf1 subunit/transcription initiation factor TFIIB
MGTDNKTEKKTRENGKDISIALTRDEFEKMITSFSKSSDYVAKELNIPVEVAQEEIEKIVQSMKKAASTPPKSNSYGFTNLIRSALNKLF